MASYFINGFYITASGRFITESSKWKAGVTVAWKDNGHPHVHLLSVPEQFITCADAEMAGLQVAARWTNLFADSTLFER